MELEGRLSQVVASYEEANDRANDLAKQLRLEQHDKQESAAMPRVVKLHDSTEMTPLGANARWYDAFFLVPTCLPGSFNVEDAANT